MTRGYWMSSASGVVAKYNSFGFYRLVIFGIAAAGVSFAAFLLASGLYGLGLILAVSTLTAMTLVAAWPRVRENGASFINTVLLLWFATTPIASFYLRYPVDRSLVTYDRLAVLMLAVLLALVYLQGSESRVDQALSKSTSEPLTAGPLHLVATRFELWWLALTALVFISAFAFSANPSAAVKIAVDSFALPLLVFHAASHFMDSKAAGKWLLLGAIALAFVLVSVGAYEIITGNNAFAYKGSDLLREGELRVNGPFASDSSYSIISALLFLFLLAAPRLFEIKLDFVGGVVYSLAVTAAGISAMLPFFREIAIAIAFSWALFELTARRELLAKLMSTLTGKDVRSEYTTQLPAPADPVPNRRRLITRTLGLWAFVLFLAGLTISLAPSALRERLLSPRNAYGRLATWTVAAKIASEHPLIGVGLGNYEDHFHQVYSGRNLSVELELDTHAASQPHSNVIWIATELGAAGLLLYLLANYHLLKIGYRGLKTANSRVSRTAAACFLALLFVYWIPGLGLTSGSYSDLNLYFFFLLGLLSGRFRTQLTSATA